MKPTRPAFEVRDFATPETADEIVADHPQFFHLERQDYDSACIVVDDKDGVQWHIDVWSERGRLCMRAEKR